MKKGCGCLLVIFVAAIVAAVISKNPNNAIRNDRQPVVAVVTFASIANTADPSIQGERKQFIEKAIANGFLQKIDTPGTSPRVYVLPAFLRLTFDEKTAIISVCYAYAFGIPKDANLSGVSGIEPMFINDAMSNKSIGSFSADSGMTLF